MMISWVFVVFTRVRRGLGRPLYIMYELERVKKRVKLTEMYNFAPSDQKWLGEVQKATTCHNNTI